MIALGPEISSNIIKRLPEGMIEKVTYEIANTTQVSSEQRKSVLSEFMEMSLAKDYITEGGFCLLYTSRCV